MTEQHTRSFVKVGSRLLVLTLLVLTTTLTGGTGQPIRFNHKLHVTDVEMDCPDCHRFVTTGRKATLPTADVCQNCHAEQQGDSPEEAKLVSLLKAGSELRWERIYVLPEHVYFSHFRHVTLGQIDCQACHGDMKQLSAPPQAPATRVNDMDYCTNCHEDRHVSTDCLACHD